MRVMETEKITITKDVLTEAYKNGDNTVKEVFERLYGKEMFRPKNIMERVKTFEDAINVLGEDHPFVKVYNASTENGYNSQKELLAYMKLRIITAALNEGWEPQFTKSDERYYPYFYFYTKKEYDAMNEDDRADLILFAASAIDGASAGLACASSNYVPSHATSDIGSRLCFKTRELAKYAGKQFIDIYVDFYRK